MALWTSRALKYLKYHRAGRSNERFGGCAAKKSPFLPKRAEQAKKAKKGPKSVSSQLCTPVPWGGAWAPSVSGCQHTQPAQNEVPGGVLGPFGGNPTKIGSFSSAAKVHYSLLGCAIEMKPILGPFWPFLLVRPVSAKTATFWPRSHQNARLTAQCDGT